MDLYFSLGHLPLAHHYFSGSFHDSKQKLFYCDFREIIALHDIIVILHRPTVFNKQSTCKSTLQEVYLANHQCKGFYYYFTRSRYTTNVGVLNNNEEKRWIAGVELSLLTVLLKN